MKNFSTKNWIIAIIIASWVTSFVVGALHGAGLLSEPENPIIHTFQDWIFVIIVMVPVSYVLARIIPDKRP